MEKEKRTQPAIKHLLILSSIPKQKVLTSSETLHRNVHLRVTDCNTYNGKI